MTATQTRPAFTATPDAIDTAINAAVDRLTAQGWTVYMHDAARTLAAETLARWAATRDTGRATGEGATLRVMRHIITGN